MSFSEERLTDLKTDTFQNYHYEWNYLDDLWW